MAKNKSKSTTFHRGMEEEIDNLPKNEVVGIIPAPEDSEPFIDEPTRGDDPVKEDSNTDIIKTEIITNFTDEELSRFLSALNEQKEESMEKEQFDRMDELRKLRNQRKKEKSDLSDLEKKELERLQTKRDDEAKDLIRKESSWKEILDKTRIPVPALKMLYSDLVNEDGKSYKIEGWGESISKQKPASKTPSWGGKRITIGPSQIPEELKSQWDENGQKFKVYAGSAFDKKTNIAKNALVLIPVD